MISPDYSIGRLGWLGACALILLTSAAPGQDRSRTIQPMTRFDSIPLACELRGARRVVTNSTQTIIAKGQKLGWKDSNGEQGSSVFQRPFHPGERIVVGERSQGPSCSAWAAPLPLPLQVAPN